MDIKVDDLSGAEVTALIMEHLQHMQSLSPPESTHALNLDGLKNPEVTFWSGWEQGELVGCGAFKELDRQHGYTRISLETGSMEAFEPARYTDDPLSSSMTLAL